MLSNIHKKLIISPSTDPYFNLAAEEFMTRNFDTTMSEYLFVYCNTPSIIIGKNQNVFEEIHWDIIRNKSLPIVRRISGGGSVCHDLGNINFSFIQSCISNKINNYSHTTGLIVKALNELKIPTYLDSRNAIRLESNHHKISGSAQFTNQKNILSHCTLLIDSNLAAFNIALKQNEFIIQSKSSKSVRSEIENLWQNYQHQIIDIPYFINQVANVLLFKTAEEFKDEHIKAIELLSVSKYQSDVWNYQKAANCTIEFPQGIIKIGEGIVLDCPFNNALENICFQSILETNHL